MPSVTPTTDAFDRDAAVRQLRLHRALEARRRLDPLEFYAPHCKGQEQFHRAPHPIRALFPGNGFGKSRAAGSEVQWWLRRNHPWHKVPSHPLIIIWACETFKQWKMLKPQIEEECLGPAYGRDVPRGWKFNKTDNVFTWPHSGDQMFLVSGDASWTHIQGINPDLVVFDEEPPVKLWREMFMRRRGRRKTRYVIAATATQGLTWMFEDLYTPWLEHHAAQGLNEEQAMDPAIGQNHPRIWCWSQGGIKDNPGADAGDAEWYEAGKFASEAEKLVRLHGGFLDFSGQPVFYPEAVERQRATLCDGQSGRIVPRADQPAEGPPLLEFVPDGPGPRGRITLFEPPRADDYYVIGHDSAYGLMDPKNDFDYAVVLSRNTGRQVAEAQGKWGPSWHLILRALHFLYGQAFLLGERQVGLFAMRNLWDKGVRYQYFHRDDADASRDFAEKLGHHRHTGDLVIPRLRIALGTPTPEGPLNDADVFVRSRELHRQLVKFQFKGRSASIAVSESHDAQLEYGAPAGDHDDGVFALAYANMALAEVARFDPPAPSYSYGQVGYHFNVTPEQKEEARRKAAKDPFGVRE